MAKYEYEDYQQHVTLLDGLEDIHPYFVKLPNPPPISKFVNYGLPKEEQFFKREQLPTKVRNLDIKLNSGVLTLDQVLAICEKDDDISSFIADQWHKRHNGIFILIFGVPTYITGQHWYYLNYHRLDTGKYADYRTTDRDYWYWRKFCVWDDPKVYGGINFTNRREGKCFGKDTLIRMYDGSVKMVQDIADGELVMGTNSEPRVVSGVTSGIDEMYRISYEWGEYVCNSDHIVTLMNSYTKEILNVPASQAYVSCFNGFGIYNEHGRISYYTIRKIGEGEYFGFAVDGNHLFLLADGTVVHNSMKAGAEAEEIATRRRNSMVGIQSKTDGDAKSFFRKFIVRQFKKLPFFFRPISGNNKNPINELKFEWGTSAGETEIEPLETIIDYRSSVPVAYDGEKLIFYIMDEAGKFLNCNPVDTWDKVKYCLIEQDRIIGKAIITTTVEEMEKGGGKAFKELWDESSRIPFHKKINNLGQTNSGLIPYFTPAYKGFIFDQFGTPIEGDPSALQQKYRYKQLIEANEKPSEALRLAKMGAIELLSHMEKTKSTEKDRQDFRRKFPNSIKQAFISAFRSCHFSFEKVSMALEKYLYTSRVGNMLENHPYNMTQGNFQWKNGVRDTEVEFKPSKNGRWLISYLPPQKESNLHEYKGGIKVPGNSMKGVAGCDPYGFSILSDTNNKPSNGGAYVWFYHDPSVDTPDIEEKDCVTDDFVCEYLNRPLSRDDFNEDVLMMCVYYGIKIFIETNKDHCINYFVERGYEGYLVIPRKAKREGKRMVIVEAEKAGAYSAANTRYKDGIFAHFEYYVENKIHRCKFPRLIESIRDVEYENTQPYDSFMSAGYCLYAAKMINKRPSLKKESYSSPIQTYGVNQS